MTKETPRFSIGQIIRTIKAHPNGLHRGRVRDIRLTKEGKFEYLCSDIWWAQNKLIGLVTNNERDHHAPSS